VFIAAARKYHLCLTLSHQHMAQLREPIRDAVLGNVGTMIAFRVGEHDGRVFEREFGRSYSARHFTELGNFQVCVKLLANGEHGDPFLGSMFPPEAKHYGRKQKLIQRSREKYATPRKVVEEKIGRWMQTRV
jgi:hypothetical protein